MESQTVHRVVRATGTTRVLAIDMPNEVGAVHLYQIEGMLDGNPQKLQQISFQNGPIKKGAANGITNEDLIAIIIDRLSNFEDGSCPCIENRLAKSDLQKAQVWLEKRSADRRDRGVEGKPVK